MGLFGNTSAGILGAFFTPTPSDHTEFLRVCCCSGQKQNLSFKFPLSQIPGFRQICLTYCALEWKVRLFSLQTALLIILCPKVISASVKWSKKHSSISSHFARHGISKKSSEQGRVCKSRPISLLLFYFSLGWSAIDLVSLVCVFFKTKNMLLFILKRTFMQFGYSDFLVRAAKLLQGAKFLFHGEIVSCSFC